MYNGSMKKEKLKENVRQAIVNDPNRDYFKRIKLFGSYLHGSQRHGSDIDLLVEFAKPLGFFKLGEIGESLENKIGKKVDLVTPDSLSKYFKKEVAKEAELIYEK